MFSFYLYSLLAVNREFVMIQRFGMTSGTIIFRDFETPAMATSVMLCWLSPIFQTALRPEKL